jgi:hypothetical protein
MSEKLRFPHQVSTVEAFLNFAVVCVSNVRNYLRIGELLLISVWEITS